jgi:hypothetical protein
VDVLFVTLLTLQMSHGHFSLLKVPSIALRNVERFSQSLNSTRAVATVALEVAVPQSMLLLKFFNHSQD